MGCLLLMRCHVDKDGVDWSWWWLGLRKRDWGTTEVLRSGCLGCRHTGRSRFCRRLCVGFGFFPGPFPSTIWVEVSLTLAFDANVHHCCCLAPGVLVWGDFLLRWEECGIGAMNGKHQCRDKLAIIVREMSLPCADMFAETNGWE